MNSHNTTASEIASEIAAAFETRERDNGDAFTCLREDAPDWIAAGHGATSFCLRLHFAIDDRGPDDWVYASAAAIAGDLSNYDTLDAMHEAVHEIADSNVEVYNLALCRWLGGNINNAALCDEAAGEFGSPNPQGVIGTIQAGQFLGLTRLTEALISEIEARLENLKGEAAS